MDVQIAANQRLYTAVADLVTTYQLVVAGRAVDALDGEPVAVPLRVTASRRELRVKALGDGLFAVAADPRIDLRLLAGSAYDFDLTLTAPGYREAVVPVPLPAGSGLPLAEITVPLRRLPVRLQGRVTAAAGGAAVAAARVGLQEADVLALRTPLGFAHPVGAPVRQCALPAVGPARQLDRPALAGTRDVVLGPRAGLAPGDLLRLGPEHRLEIAVVDGLAPQPADLDLPGVVTLRSPLRRSLPGGAPAQEVNPVPGAAVQLLARVAEAGEAILVLAGDLPVPAVRIEAAASPRVEYHATGALADAAGYYRLDGVAGVAAATLVASAAGFDDGIRPWSVDYATPVNVLDFRLETP